MLRMFPIVNPQHQSSSNMTGYLNRKADAETPVWCVVRLPANPLQTKKRSKVRGRKPQATCESRRKKKYIETREHRYQSLEPVMIHHIVCFVCKIVLREQVGMTWEDEGWYSSTCGRALQVGKGKSGRRQRLEWKDQLQTYLAKFKLDYGFWSFTHSHS